MQVSDHSSLQAAGYSPLPLRPLAAFDGSLAQRTHAALKEAILTLGLQPGAALSKPDICAHLGVSRSPVSEAFARLAVEGLVDVVPQAGTFVARLSVQEIREGAFLRQALELAAVERVAGTITPDQIGLLHDNLDLQARLIVEQDSQAFHRADAALHELIHSFTGFRRLTQVADTAWVHVNRARRLILPQPGRVGRTLEEHRAIVAALDARDAPRARAAMQHHLDQLLILLEPEIAARPEVFDQG